MHTSSSPQEEHINAVINSASVVLCSNRFLGPLAHRTLASVVGRSSFVTSILLLTFRWRACDSWLEKLSSTQLSGGKGELAGARITGGRVHKYSLNEKRKSFQLVFTCLIMQIVTSRVYAHILSTTARRCAINKQRERSNSNNNEQKDCLDYISYITILTTNNHNHKMLHNMFHDDYLIISPKQVATKARIGVEVRQGTESMSSMICSNWVTFED